MQMNIRIDSDFDRQLNELMQLTGSPNKTSAIKAAVEETLLHLRKQRNYDFKDVIGVAGALIPRARFKSDDDVHADE